MSNKNIVQTTVSIPDKIALKVAIQMKLYDDHSFNEIVNNLLEEKLKKEEGDKSFKTR